MKKKGLKKKNEEYESFWLDEFERLNEVPFVKFMDDLTQKIMDVIADFTNRWIDRKIDRKWKKFKKRCK